MQKFFIIMNYYGRRLFVDLLHLYLENLFQIKQDVPLQHPQELNYLDAFSLQFVNSDKWIDFEKKY